MLVNFTKMHGLGNDFVVINTIDQKLELNTKQLRFIANRRVGIGCDQILLLGKSSTANVDFNYRIFNSDGAEVEQCGNGARCFALFIKENNLSSQSIFRVATCSGIIELELLEHDLVRVNMGIPNFIPAEIPFNYAKQQDRYDLSFDNKSYQISVVSIGNPHAVLVVEDLENTAVLDIGAKIESADVFPNRINVGFMQIIDRSHIRLRVYERGVGETQACGTGACAAMVVAKSLGLVSSEVNVALTGGILKISWQDDQQAVTMVGTATSVYQGQILL